MVRVLHIFYNMGNGGIEHFVMDFYRHIDRSKVQFDFLTSVDEPGYFDDEIHGLGGQTYKAYPLKKNPAKNFCDIARIVQKNKYQIVHRHTGSAFGYFELRAAKLGGAKNCILHSHNPQAGNPKLHMLCQKILKMNCIKFACSQEAGEFLFGKKAKFKVINNAIECDKYAYNKNVRKEVRDELELGDAFVVGHIGRFEYQKNHERLLCIFKELLKEKPNSYLVCVGEGSLMEERKQQAMELGISERIKFLGTRNDVYRIIQSFDIFCFPSRYEGFSITQIEAQVNGLKCFTAKDKVPESSNITGNITFIPLGKKDREWAKIILDKDITRDLRAIEIVKEAGYDIGYEARKLQDYYLSLE